MKILRKIIILITCLLYTMSVFAAIVSDNDGSAFVTKSEFEAMKNNFSSQVNQYNTSIDTKIDGAIASYLAGINIEQPPTLLWGDLKRQMGDVWFYNNALEGDNSIVTNNKVSLNRHFTLKKYNNIVQFIYLQVTDVKFPSMPDRYDMQGTYNGTGVSWWINNEICAASKRHNGAEVLTGSYLRFDDDASSWLGTSVNVDLSNHQIPNTEAWNSVGWNRPTAMNWNNTNHVNELTSAKFNHLVNKTIETTGSGSYYEYYTNPAGYKVLRNFYTSAYPVYDLGLTAHTYKNFAGCTSVDQFRNIYCVETGKSDNTSLSYTVDEKSKWGSYTFGDRTKVADDSEETMAYFATLNLYQVKTNDGYDYGVFLLGKNANKNVYCLDKLATITVESETTVAASETATTFQENQNLITGEEACTQNLSGCQLKYKSIKLTPVTFQLKDFINEYVTTIAGETTYLGGGIPIINVISEDQSLNVKIKFKSRDGDGVEASSNIRYQLSDKQFDNCNIATNARVLAEGTVATGTEVEFRIEQLKKGNVWMNFYSETDGYSASIDAITVSVI